MLSVCYGLFLLSQEEHWNNKYTESELLENACVKSSHTELIQEKPHRAVWRVGIEEAIGSCLDKGTVAALSLQASRLGHGRFL
jgi:hypothetical protein